MSEPKYTKSQVEEMSTDLITEILNDLSAENERIDRLIWPSQEGKDYFKTLEDRDIMGLIRIGAESVLSSLEGEDTAEIAMSCQAITQIIVTAMTRAKVQFGENS